MQYVLEKEIHRNDLAAKLNIGGKYLAAVFIE